MLKKKLTRAVCMFTAAGMLMTGMPVCAEAAQTPDITSIKADASGKKATIKFAKQKNAKKYMVQMKQDGKWKTAKTTTGTTATVGTKNGKKYTFRVVAVGKNGKRTNGKSKTVCIRAAKKTSSSTTQSYTKPKLTIKQDDTYFICTVTNRDMKLDGYVLTQTANTGKYASLTQKDRNMNLNSDNAKIRIPISYMRSTPYCRARGYVVKNGKRVYVTRSSVQYVETTKNLKNVQSPDGAKVVTSAVARMNKERKAHGLNPVKWDSNLEMGAKIRAKDLEVKFAHERPEQEDTFDNRMDPFKYMMYPTLSNEPLCASFVLNGTGVYDRQICIGENIICGISPHEDKMVDEAFDWWMDSPGHRMLILEPSVEAICFAYYTQDGNTSAILVTSDYYTQGKMSWKNGKLYVK